MNHQLERSAYYDARAAASRELARRAATPTVAAIHSELATRYEQLASQSDRQGAVISTTLQAV